MSLRGFSRLFIADDEEPEGSGDDKLDGISDSNSEPDFAAGAVTSALAANEYERSVEPMGMDDSDQDDMDTGTTGPTIQQTDVDPDNAVTAALIKKEHKLRRIASWLDVQAKAKRIKDEGGVRIISVTGPYVTAHVKGDEGVYESTLQRGSTGSVDQWTCSCPWFAYSFGRSGRWKKYEGRMCVTPSTMISMADGTFKRIDEVELGDWVVTHDGVGKVTQLIVNEYDGPLKSIQSAGYALPLQITPNHEMWAYGTPQRLFKSWQRIKGQGFKFYDESFLLDNDPTWIDAGDLKVHDWVTGPILPTSHRNYFDLAGLLDDLGVDYEVEDGRIYTTHRGGRHVGSLPVHLPPSDAIMDIVGIYLAEGNFDSRRNEVQWTIHQDEEYTYGKLLQVALDQLGAGSLRAYRRPDVTKGISLRLTNRPLALLLHHLAGSGSRLKQLHPWIMTMPPDLQQRMFDAYWTGDGHQSKSRRKISTTSDILAQQVHALLLRCGHLPSWSISKNNGGPNARDKSLTINTVSYVPSRTFTNGQRPNGEGFYSSKINEIEEVQYQGLVYNLKVDGQESYVANGRIVHNCSHALALQYQAQSEGMFGKDIKEQQEAPQWDNGKVDYYEAPPPKDWRASKTGSLVVYRGVDTPENVQRTLSGSFGNGDAGPGIYTTTNPDYAADFSRHSRDDDGYVLKGTISDGAKVLSEDKFWDHEGDYSQSPAVWAKANGYDVVHMDIDQPTYYVVVNPSVIRWEPSVYRARFGESIRQAQRRLASVIPLYSVTNPLPGEDIARQYASSPSESDFMAAELGVLSRLYRDLPVLDRAAVGLWEQLGQLVTDQANELRQTYDIQVFDHVDPYDTAAQMHADIEKKVYKVTSMHSHHPVWDVETNVNFRITHDILGHGKAQSDFSFHGEVQAYQAQCDVTPESLWTVLFSEIVAQSAYANIHHLFGEQKVGLIDISPDAAQALVGKVSDAPDPEYDSLHFSAAYDADVKESIHLWSTIKVNNQKALPNPYHDGFRYAFHQVMGDSTGFRAEPSDPEFIKGEHMATVFLNAFIENQTPGRKPYYRAIGLHPDTYHEILESAQDGELDLPPASWSANKNLTEQFGLTYEQGTKSYEKRIIFKTVPGASSWALGRISNTGYEREHIVGGRFHVNDIKFPNDGDNTTIITLSEVQGWPEDFNSAKDLIDHLSFDSEVYSPQDSKTAAHVDPHKGLMIAVRPPQSVCDELVLTEEGAEENAQLHVTLAYIGPEESEGLDLDALRQVVIAEAALATPPAGSLTGYGRFDTPDGEVVVCLVDSEELQVARHHLVKALERAGIEISHAHGFTPHITLIYQDGYDFGSLPKVDKQPFQFTEFIISPPSGVWETYPIGGAIAVEAYSDQYLSGGDPTPADELDMIQMYLKMHGEYPSDEMLKKMRRKRRHASDIGTSPVGDSEEAPSFATSPDPSAQWPDTELEEQRPHAAFLIYADDEGAALPSDAEMDTEDPSGSPDDSIGETSALPGAQATLDEEPEGALPATDGTSSEPDETYETDEQNNTHLYGDDDGAAETTIRGGGDTTVASLAWLDPKNSNKGVGADNMDIAAAARNYLMTSTAVKTFTFAEQQEIINEGDGSVTASNLDRLQLEGTHYETLEAQLARADETGEQVLWW